MVTMDAFASAFGFDAKSDDVWTTLGKVTAVSGNTLSVLLGGSATPTQCEAYCVAGVGDIVFVAISKGQARAIATHGGVNDAAKWRGLLGLGSIATHPDYDYLKRVPANTSELPQDTTMANGFPIVLSDTFANGGEISYMTKSNFMSLLGLGSTTFTNSVTGKFTAASGVSVNWFTLAQWGRVVSVSLSWKRNSSITVPADGNITDFDIGTFDSSLCPPNEIHGVSSGDAQCWYWMGTNGVLKVGACEGTGAQRTIAANTTFDFHATWLIA